MKKFMLIVAVAAIAVLADSQLASAARGGCGGRGGRGGRHGGGCGGGCGGYVGGCGGCGSAYGGCGYGGCGMGGCGMGGCGYVGGCGAGGCGGVCTLGGGAALAQATGTQATIVVSLPEDATLTIDDEATASTSSQRVFVTPALEAGKAYEYTLKAQIVRDGKTQTATAQVKVRPGEVSRVELTVPATVAAQ